jgi:hypothetical protein
MMIRASEPPMNDCRPGRGHRVREAGIAGSDIWFSIAEPVSISFDLYHEDMS